MSDQKQLSNSNEPEAVNSNLLVAIGGSAGSLKEIFTIVEQLPEWFEGTLLIATHRPPSDVNSLVKLLNDRARVHVEEPQDEGDIACTRIYVGRPGDRVEVDGNEFDVTEDRSQFARIRRIDDLFKSVARSAGKNAVGVILSGALTDGVEGLLAIHEAGGTCIVQKPDEAHTQSMPMHALEAVPAAFIESTQEICSHLMELALGRRCQ